MTLLRRAPREVYRVYSEAEFFDGAAGVEVFAPATATGAGERRLRRLAGAAMLAGAVGTMGGAVVLTGSRPTRGSGRRAGNADLHAFAHAGLARRAYWQLKRGPAAGGAGITTSAYLAGRARFDARVQAEHMVLAAETSHRERRPRAEHAEREGRSGDAHGGATTLTVDAASGSAPVPAVASDGAPTPVPAVAHSSSPSPADTSPPPATPSVERAEFGFER
jgi:hypothetical protein